jgi:hypothetical protein
MRSGMKIGAIGLLLAMLGGCNRKAANVSPAPDAQAPSRPPAQMADLMPKMPTVPPNAETRPVKLDTSVPAEETSETTAPPPRRVRHHPKPTTTQEATQPEVKAPAAADTPTPQGPEVASGQPSENSPIGQLSPANGDSNTADRQQLTAQINTTENRLNGIHRSMNADEQKTVALIRTFITKAREALKTDDVDGAKGFATKAKLLLEELTKP